MFGNKIIRSNQPVCRRGCFVVVAAQCLNAVRMVLAALSNADSLVTAAERRRRLPSARPLLLDK